MQLQSLRSGGARKHRFVFLPRLLPLPADCCAHKASVFLRYSRAQAVAGCKHTSAYQHRVGCTGFISFLLLGNSPSRIKAGKKKIAADGQPLQWCKTLASVSRASQAGHSRYFGYIILCWRGDGILLCITISPLHTNLPSCKLSKMQTWDPMSNHLS